MSITRLRQCGTYVAVAGASLGLLAGLSSSPAIAKPNDNAKDKKASAQNTAASLKRVMPLAEGRYRFSTAFGVAGPMWASGHHTGVDFGADPGVTILAAQDGTVVFTGNGGPYGNLTRIDHGGGVETWYAHQSAIVVSPGQKVRAGQPIGAVGATGNVTGPHLHFEVRVNGALSNPMPWLAGAAAVPAVGLPGGMISPDQVESIRAGLAEAEAKVHSAQAESEAAAVEEAKIQKQLKKAQVEAAQAKEMLAGYAREVYKSGADPQFLLQADAVTSGDLAQFTDREVLLAYANNSQNREVNNAIAAIKRATQLHEKAETLKNTAAANLAAAMGQYQSLFGALSVEDSDAKAAADKAKTAKDSAAKAKAKKQAADTKAKAKSAN